MKRKSLIQSLREEQAETTRMWFAALDSPGARIQRGGQSVGISMFQPTRRATLADVLRLSEDPPK